jgi:hypothetical protein
MLSGLEGKLTAIVGDGLSTRTHLTVLQAPNAVDNLAAGKGAVRISISDLLPQSIFERDHFTFTGSAGAQSSRRILPLQITANIDFQLKPASVTPGGLASGRTLLLDDMALVGHLLETEVVHSGGIFKTAGADSGFQVRSFDLGKGTISNELVDGLLRGSLSYQGMVEIWPPGLSTPEGEMKAIERVIAPLPINVSAAKASVRVGEVANIHIGSIKGNRLLDLPGGNREALKLSIRVVSDLPPAARGQITSGEPGAETGSQIVATTEPETVIIYKAPTGNIGSTQLEFVAVHLATPEKKSGLFLGSAAVRLVP